MSIRANDRDARHPRFGIDPWSWSRIVALAQSYQQAEGAYDWPQGVTPPDPRETNCRLLFARWLAQAGRLES